MDLVHEKKTKKNRCTSQFNQLRNYQNALVVVRVNCWLSEHQEEIEGNTTYIFTLSK